MWNQFKTIEIEINEQFQHMSRKPRYNPNVVHM